jgi:hypothetical protein
MLKGKILDEENKGIKANILIKNSENKELISEFFSTNNSGDFLLKLKKNYKTLYFEITSYGYSSIEDSIINPIQNQEYQFKYTLSKKNIELQEVKIISEKKVSVVGDTIKFNPKLFKDGSEKKVEDLIKKLPGMEVDNNGSIKYNGKTVTAVQLEGDDLFGFNYSIGTKNISIDMIEQVQAIDNYTSNPLLKGIESTENVSINLKLKKGKIDLSGNGNIGLGIGNNDVYSDTGANLLGISKKYKSFGNFNFNNIGINYSQDDYFTMSKNLDDFINEEFLAKKAISEYIGISNFDSQRSNINNQLSGSYNIIYRISKKISIKSNIFYTKDRIESLDENNISFNNQNITYFDKSELIKKPENKKLDLKLSYNLSANSLLELETNIKSDKILTNNEVNQNQNIFFNTNLKSLNNLVNTKLLLTFKISNKTAIQLLSFYSKNDLPQKLQINPISFSFSGNTQKSKFEKVVLNNKLILLSSSKNSKLALTLGFNNQENPYSSKLLDNEISILEFDNDFNYKKSNFYFEYGSTYIHKNWKFQPTLKLNNISQEYIDFTSNTNQSKKIISVLPNLSVSFQFNPKSTIKISSAYDEKTSSEEYLISNFIIQNNRQLNKSTPSLNIIKNQKYTISFRHNDIFKSLSFNTTMSYDKKQNSYLSAVEILNDYSIFKYFQSPSKIENYYANIGFEKYFKSIKTTIKYNNVFGQFKYKNSINQSELKENYSISNNNSIFAKTAFRNKINFENKLNYLISTFYSQNVNNKNVSYNNNFKIIFKPNSKWFLSGNYDYYKPNTKKQDNFSFIDFEIKHKPEKIKWLEIWITAKNLLNQKKYFQTDNSDYQTSLFSSSLINRYILLNFEIKF